MSQAWDRVDLNSIERKKEKKYKEQPEESVGTRQMRVPKRGPLARWSYWFRFLRELKIRYMMVINFLFSILSSFFPLHKHFQTLEIINEIHKVGN